MKQNLLDRRLIVYVDVQEHGIWSGHVFGTCLDAPLAFDDLSGLLLQIDAELDRLKFPQAYQRKRRFITRPAQITANPAYDQTIDKLKEHDHSFAINIITRHHTNWQGMVDWLDGRPVQIFASELELLRLLSRNLA